MASQWDFTDLEEEMTCPICLDILQDPVTIECGHNFCNFCITQLQEASKYHIKCFRCKTYMKKNTYAPNLLLANLIEKIRGMDPSERQQKEKELRFPKHGEKLHYVCEADGQFLCVVCHDSKEHKLHVSRVIEEAVKHRQEQIQSHVGILEQKEQELVHMKAQVDKNISQFKIIHLTSQDKYKLIEGGCKKILQDNDKVKQTDVAILISDVIDFDLKNIAQVHVEKQRIHTEFTHLQQVLEENKNFLLSNIEQQAQHGVKECEHYNAATQALLTSLKDLKDSLKAKEQMLPRQLLQGIKGILHRSEEFQVQLHSKTPIPLDLDQQLNEAKSRHDSVIDTLRKCGDQLKDGTKKDQDKMLQDKRTTCQQTSDPTFTTGSSTLHTPTLCQPRYRSSFTINLASPDPRLLKGKTFLARAPGNASEDDARNTRSTHGPSSSLELQLMLTPVIFNVASAHPDLKFSQDLKTVTMDMILQKYSEDPAEPQHFYPSRCVLGSPGFSTGCHSWVVERSGPQDGSCVLGVAWEQAPRKGGLTLEPKSGFWVLRFTSSNCRALTGRDSWELLPVCPRRVGVCVDLEGEEVSFYDPDTKDHIYTFQASFPGKIFPFFKLLFSGTQLTLSP
ncbi:E3 ubiquitin-protein ligase TRIM31-like [Ochotona curzoniae]|uniref:E3 ubiquitin-protein ligase TRIM31-like n=1 Tax=Ochotona curzoniae TaxID=130825 RepID=UPI001B34D3DE|nr:E3 ubiquitin-protein ligase TRIM31-like [Ochotona curzoniae]